MRIRIAALFMIGLAVAVMSHAQNREPGDGAQTPQAQQAQQAQDPPNTPENKQTTDAGPGDGVQTAEEHAILVDQIGEKMLAQTAERLSGRLGRQARRHFMGIELWRYVTCFLILVLTFLASFLLTVLLVRYGVRLAQRTESKVDDLVFQSAALPGRIAVQAVGIYLAFMLLLTGLDLPPLLVRWFGRLCLAAAAGAVFWYVYHLVDAADYYMRRFAARTDNDFDNSFVDVLRKTLRLFVIALGVLFIGTYILDWDITALLASAGIAGLALAFAAQDTIANLFGTVMLLLDRPFRVGERIVLEGADGPVESIGFRSTRIRTLDGNQVSIPNKSVANSKIENVGRRPHIKRVTTIGVTYDTPFEKVRKGVQIIRDILQDHEGMDPDYPPRVYFSEFGPYSLDILVITWYHPGEYWDYMAWCEQVNFRIMKAFEDEGIEFAFPTSTTYLAGDPKRPLNFVNPAGSRPDDAP